MSDTEEDAGGGALIIQLPERRELFKPDTMTNVLATITSVVREHVADVTTERGRKEIASLAMRVSKSKVVIDNAGKGLVEDWKKQASAVDKERKRARDTLDALRDECRKPLTDYEAAEAKALAAAEAAIAELVRQSSDTRLNSDEIGKLMLRIMTEANDQKFGKHQGKFDEARNEALTKLSALLVDARAREHAQRVEAERQAARDAELAELRAKLAAVPVVQVPEADAWTTGFDRRQEEFRQTGVLPPELRERVKATFAADLANQKADAPLVTFEDLRDALAQLLEWDASMGGWEGQAWENAHTLMRRLRDAAPSA